VSLFGEINVNGSEGTGGLHIPHTLPPLLTPTLPYLGLMGGNEGLWTC
jgi:hypothetical protein